MKKNIRHKTAVSLLVVQLILAMVLAVVHYFTHARMGMARHMSHLNTKFRAALPMDMLVKVLLVVAVVCAVLALVIRLRRGIQGAGGWVLCALELAAPVFTVAYTLSSNASKDRAYFALVLGLALINLLSVPLAPLSSKK